MASHAQRQRHGRTGVHRGAARGLPAKLVGRSAADVIDRQRLFERIDSQADRPLLWVQGPAGAGKTTLVASYLARRRLPPLWYRVDDGDIDAPTVFSYLARAAAAITRKRGPALPALTPEYLLDVAGFARRFFRTFWDSLPPRAAVVFDSFENAPGDALHQLLLVAADEAPPGQRVIVTSRDAPAERLAHLPAKGAMAVIGWDALRLTSDEARAVAGDAAAADPDVVARLHHAADGWAAGFVVLLAQARGSGAAQPALTPAASEQLFAYYLNELFASADASLQTLLTHTALLPSFTAAQAAALTPGTDVAAMLGRLLRRHFFISRSSDAADAVYTYHPLFREFLLRHGGEQLGRDARRALLLQAASLLLAAAEDEAALDLLIQAEARAQAAEVLCRLAPRLLQQGRSKTLLQAIAALPPGTSAVEDWLAYWHGTALLPLAPPQACTVLERAYAGFDAGSDAIGRLLACAGILDSYLEGFSDMRPVDDWGKLLQRLLDAAPEPLPPEVEGRVLMGFPVLIFRGHIHAQMVADGCARALSLLQRLHDPVTRVTTARLVVLVQYLGGEWSAGRRFIDDTSPLLPPPSVMPAYAAIWKAMKARLMVWDGDAAAALAVSDEGERIAADHNVVTLAALTASAGVFAGLNLDDAAQAESSLRRMRAGVRPSRRLDVATLDLQSGMLALLRGQPQQAAADLGAALAKALDQGAELLAAQFRIVLALALAETGEPAAAARELMRVHDYAAAAWNQMLNHSALMVRAWLAQRDGDTGGALELLRDALPLGRRNGYRVIFPWVPLALLQGLGLLALQHGIEPDYVRDLLRLRRVPSPAVDCDDWPWRVRVTTLGRFDLVVDERPLDPTQKSQKKPLDLLRVLVAAGTGGVAPATVQGHVWPDGEGDRAVNSYNVALHRLRKLLGDEQAIVLEDGRLRLDAHRVWTDTEAFGSWVERIDAAADAADAAVLAQSLLRLYGGAFLADADLPWALPLRERLRSRFVRAADALAKRLEKNGEREAAVDLLRRAIEIEPGAEQLHHGLMRVLVALGRRAEAIDVYERCRTLLQTLLRAQPSAEMEALSRGIRS